MALASTLPATPSRLSLLHTDFHPRNVMLSRGRATIIDLDNLRVGDARSCAAFSVLRFARPLEAARPAERLRRILEFWALAYEKAGGTRLDTGLYTWMARIELEKILRIRARVRDTGAYRSFLPNCARLHLPNLRLLLALAR
jgi:aminoglycoside phosphotransferase (APT) family kinase protein